MIFRDVQQKLKTKRDVLPYLVTQMWEIKKSNVQCVSCSKNYNNFTNKTVTRHKRKTGTYTGSSFWVTHMNKKIRVDTSKVTTPEVMCFSSCLYKIIWVSWGRLLVGIWLFLFAWARQNETPLEIDSRYCRFDLNWKPSLWKKHVSAKKISQPNSPNQFTNNVPKTYVAGLVKSHPPCPTPLHTPSLFFASLKSANLYKLSPKFARSEWLFS